MNRLSAFTEKYINAAFLFKSATIFLALLLLSHQLYHVFNGPIWRDDAYFGIVAKNIVNGFGYSAVYFDKSYLLHFGISLGPVMVLPTALMVYIFGNQYWVLGLTNVLFIWGLLIAIFIYSKDLIGKEKRLHFSFLGLLLAIVFTNSQEIYPYGIDFKSNLALWHLLMGEIPAALFIILGTILLFSANNSYKKISAAGIILGLAILIKTIAILCAFIVCAAFSALIFCSKESNKKKFLLVTILGITSLAPLLTFEVTKRITLDAEAYQQLQIQNSEYYTANSLIYKPRHNNNVTAIPAPYKKFQDFINHIGKPGIAALLILKAFIIFLFYKNKSEGHDKYIRIAGTGLIVSFLITMFWWITCGNDNKRYIITGLLCYLAGITMLLSSVRYTDRKQVLCAMFILCLLFSSRLDAIQYPFYYGFKIGNRMKEQLVIANQVDKLQKMGVQMFSCGNNFELEYLLPKNNNFKECSELPGFTGSKAAMLVTYFAYPGFMTQTHGDDYFTNSIKVPDFAIKHCRKNFLRSNNFSMDWCDTTIN